ncbi:hypothetical protein B5X24_HaOG208348 [Helicoverpa armigera]|uniref:Uncharacterized protein n=1 Tax=Helicoverpa armigera TaxID=29058 RepID=A0A2W1BLE2_HELAM|nr:hypothetical protein B5X24_HaOG208348 [Helicoverpa armigera]
MLHRLVSVASAQTLTRGSGHSPRACGNTAACLQVPGNSKMEDTVFATLPPLYGLDEWSQCQRDGDVYCIVDAALYSPRPSPAMMLLQVCANNPWS